LSLQGNQLTSEAAKKFFSVVRQNNNTLQQLDLSDNPSVDHDILEAINQFMQQRQLRTKLFIKQGGDNPIDKYNFDSVTVLCQESILDGTFDPEAASLDGCSPQPEELNLSMTPLANESFMHYMQRVQPPEKNKKTLKAASTALLASRRLHAQSRRQLLGQQKSSSNIDSTIPSSRDSSFTSRSSAPSTHKDNGEEPKKDKKTTILSNGEVGVYQVNEAAPNRQRLSGARRNRTPMTESQRMARLSALTDSQAISGRSAATFGRNSTRRLNTNSTRRLDTFDSAAVESYNENDVEAMQRLKRDSSMFGLDDEMRGDCIACSCIIFLMVILLVMIGVYFMVV
jgi:hypothetical protein